MNFNKLIGELVQNPIVVDYSNKYTNNIELNGFIVKKPRFFKHDKSGIESCSFVLFQLTNNASRLEIASFSCMTYIKELVDQLRQVDKVLMVHCSGKLIYSKKVQGCYPQVIAIETLYEFDLDLENELWNTLERKKMYMN